MADEPFTTPGWVISARVPRPGERLFEFVCQHVRILCELRDHQVSGTEAQFYRNERFLYSRRFDTRAEATVWAQLECGKRLRKGASKWCRAFPET